MKTIILEISDCSECPFCKYIDQYDGYRTEDIGQEPLEEGFYCTKMHPCKFIDEYYNDNKGNTLKIPSWCELKDA